MRVYIVRPTRGQEHVQHPTEAEKAACGADVVGKRVATADAKAATERPDLCLECREVARTWASEESADEASSR